MKMLRNSRTLVACILCVAILFTFVCGSAESTYADKVTLDLAISVVGEGQDFNHGNEVDSHYTDKFNLEFNVIPLGSDESDKIRTWLFSNDLPDMVQWGGINVNEVPNYVDQGLLNKLPDDWKTRWPNLAAASENAPLNDYMSEKFGGTYLLMRPVYSQHRPTERLTLHYTAYLRQDWADAMGYELKDAMKLSEILDYAQAVKDNNPGNIEGEFYPVCGGQTAGYMNVFFNSTYAGGLGSPFYKNADGKYQWGAANEATLNGLKNYSRMLKDGLINPEFYNLKFPDDNAPFYVTGTSAVMIAEGMGLWMNYWGNTMKQYLGLDWEKAVRPVVVLGEDGYVHSAAIDNYYGAIFFSTNVDNKVMERALDLLDYSCSQEGIEMIRMGIKGKHWDVGPDGEYVSLDSTYVDSATYDILGYLYILQDDFQFVNPSFSKYIRDTVQRLYELREQLSTEETAPMVSDNNLTFYSSRAFSQSSLDYSTEYAKLALQDGEIEANWKAWVEEKLSVINPVLDELNSQFGNE